MRLQLIGINYAPEIISTAVYSTGLAEYMASEGVETDVVTALPYYPAWKIFDGWRGFRWRCETPAPRLRVTHCPLYVPANPTGLRRILHHASFALSAAPKALWSAWRNKPDVIFVVAPSMMAAPVGWLAARIAGGKAWLHIQDYEVEAAFATGLLKKGTFLGRAAQAYEAWALARFDKISSISKPMLAKLSSKGVPDHKIYELRNWANIAKVTPLEGPSPLKDELGIKTKFVALYSGNLANKQGLEILPEIARKLAHRDDLTIVVCGDGPMRAPLEAMAKGLENIRFLPLQPLDRLSDLLGMSDVHLLPQIAGAADLVLPSKLTNMLASGRPTLATAHPDTALGQEVLGAGVLVEPGDGGAAAAALETLLDNPGLRSEMGREARSRALTRWDMQAILNNLKNAFEQLAKAGA